MQIDDIVGKYVLARDAKAKLQAKHKLELQPVETILDQLEGLLLEHLNATGVESARTTNGTAYKTTRTSATVADWPSVLDHIQKTENWDLLERRVNKTAVEDYFAEHGAYPLGVKISSELKVNVRR